MNSAKISGLILIGGIRIGNDWGFYCETVLGWFENQVI